VDEARRKREKREERRERERERESERKEYGRVYPSRLPRVWVEGPNHIEFIMFDLCLSGLIHRPYLDCMLFQLCNMIHVNE